MYDRLTFEVVIRLPVARDGAQRIINNLSTEYSNFAHFIGDMGDSFFFRSLNLQTSNSHVSVESLQGSIVSVKSSNGPISGSYYSNSSLKLMTSNANINAKILIENNNTNKPGDLVLRTSNGPIKCDIELNSPSNNSAFNVVATTSNNYLNLAFPAHATSSLLFLEAHSSNGPAMVSLHPAFEGKYAITTSNARGDVQYDLGVEDPSGEGRPRHVDTKYVRGGQTVGAVWWGEANNSLRGYAHLTTSNSPATLILK